MASTLLRTGGATPDGHVQLSVKLGRDPGKTSTDGHRSLEQTFASNLMFSTRRQILVPRVCFLSLNPARPARST